MNVKVTQSVRFDIHCFDENMVEFRTINGKWDGRIKSDLEAKYDSNGKIVKAFDHSETWKEYVMNEVQNLLADYPSVFIAKALTVDILTMNGQKIETFTILQ